jgi:hypothetical protein
VLGAVLALVTPLSVTTYHGDDARTGANVRERLLTPRVVNVRQFGKLASYAVDGQIYGQPLYLAAVSVGGRGVHEVVYVATEHDSVYAFDAAPRARESRMPLWRVSFLDSRRGVTSVPAADFRCEAIEPEIGITSTPVIDAATGTLYVVGMTKERSGAGYSYVQRLHALDVRTGAERAGSPVIIEASAPGGADGTHNVVFNPANHKQRAGLALVHGVVYTLWASHCDRPRPFHGWLIGYDAHTLKQTVVYNTTPNGDEGAFWSAGAAPAVDARGDLFVVSGNGSFDLGSTPPDLSSSYLKLSPGPGLRLLDSFTPHDYARLNLHDLDLAAGGTVLLPDEVGSAQHPHLLVAAGKDGRIYLLDRDRLGAAQITDDRGAVQRLDGALHSYYFGDPAYFDRRLYFCSSFDRLKAFGLRDGALSLAPLSQSRHIYVYPGCQPSVSANGSTDGIVWTIDDPGTLRAYDASDLDVELYNSDQNPGRDHLGNYVKFSVPTVVAGRVYAGTARALVVYGLLARR